MSKKCIFSPQITRALNFVTTVVYTIKITQSTEHSPANSDNPWDKNDTRLEANPVWLGSVEWWLEVGCWPPKPVNGTPVGTEVGKRIKG